MGQMRKVRIGIDIGSKGAIAIFIDGELEMYCAIPIGVDRKCDVAAFSELISDWIGKDDDIHCVIEDLHSIYGTGAASNFTFGWVNGVTEAILATWAIPYTKVQAKKWQKEMWEGVRPVQINTGKKDKKGLPKYKTDTKATSLLAAKRLFPDEDFLATTRSKVPHDGIVDAILLAEYCRRHF